MNYISNKTEKNLNLEQTQEETIETNSTVQKVKTPFIQQLTIISELKVMINKLLIVILGMIFISLVAILFAWNRAGKVDDSRELLYVQMWGDGSYRVLESLPEDDKLINSRLIDSLLEKYIKYRYGLIPQTATADLGDATVFMSEQVYNDFKSEQGFNVSKVISEISTKTNIVEIKWRGTPDHYDSIEGTYNNKKRDILKSNIYITRIEKDPLGQEIKREYLIVRLQWFLKDKEELKHFTSDDLRVNPIGLVILSGELIFDHIPNEK